MRRLAWGLLLAYVFAIPWEYSLDLGEPWGNVARMVGLLLLAATLPTLLEKERPLPIGWIQGLVLALYLWFCLCAFWSVDQVVTLAKLRAFFQEMVVVFLVVELARTPRDLRLLLRATVAGGWVLALLTLAEFRSVEALAEQQLRYAAFGQDPNDVARFLDLGLPLAALLGYTDPHRAVRWGALGYLPVALVASLLTASRGGLLAALVALAGCAVLLLRGRPRLQRTVLMTLPPAGVALWIAIPATVLERLSTIPEQMQGGSLNERMNIWAAGWDAFLRAPLVGHGPGNFTQAAGLRPEDTAHNTALALLVAGGLAALFLATVLAAFVLHAAWRLAGPLRTALVTALAVFAVTSMVASVEESRFTWLLVALIALAHRLQSNVPEELAASFAEAAATNTLPLSALAAPQP
jgi:O-antigen ligase